MNTRKLESRWSGTWISTQRFTADHLVKYYYLIPQNPQKKICIEDRTPSHGARFPIQKFTPFSPTKQALKYRRAQHDWEFDFSVIGSLNSETLVVTLRIYWFRLQRCSYEKGFRTCVYRDECVCIVSVWVILCHLRKLKYWYYEIR